MSAHFNEHSRKIRAALYRDKQRGRLRRQTWGLEGNLFWFVVGGAFASVVTLLLLFSVWHWNLLSAVVPALIPLGSALLYALAFRQGKPSGYDIDLFELWLKGAGFGPAILRVKAPPIFSSNDDV